MSNDPVFELGDAVRCVDPSGPYLKEGEICHVVRYTAPRKVDDYTRPAYAGVRRSDGRIVLGMYASRFVKEE